MIAGGSDVVMLQLILFLALFLPLELNKLKSRQGICILKLVNTNMWITLSIWNDERVSSHFPCSKLCILQFSSFQHHQKKIKVKFKKNK